MRRFSATALVGLGHLALQFQRRVDRVHRAGELDQHPVAHDLDDASTMGAHRGLQDRRSPLLQRRQGARLVKLHQPRIADDICDHDRGKAAVDAIFGHSGSLPR